MIHHKLLSFTIGLAMVGGVTLTTGSAHAAKVAEDDQFLKAKVVVAPYVRASRGGASFRIPVDINLTNTGKEDLEVQAPSTCQVHDFVITKPNNDVIFQKPKRPCAQAIVSQVIKAGETITATTAIKVPSGMFAEGRRYFLKYQFWGVQAKAPMRVHFND